MRRLLALSWLALVLLAAGYLGWRAQTGFGLQSSLLVLLPMEQQDPVAEAARRRVADAFSRRVVIMLGHADAGRARAAGRAFAEALRESGLASGVTAGIDRDAQQVLGTVVFPHRAGLLAEADRHALLAGRGEALARRALGVMFGPTGFGDAQIVAHDPFLLLPAWLTALPMQQSRLMLEDGQLVARDQGMTLAFITAELLGDPFALTFQQRFADFLAATLPADVRVLRTGSVFYASEGARLAMDETSTIGSISMAATVAMLLLVFRRLRPMLLGVLAVVVGIGMATAFCLWWFAALHSVALLFGASLIGVAVDYSLEYFSECFGPGAPSPMERLRRVLPGVAIGLGTTLIGYLTLLLAPFPGLRQIAAFSVIGLLASFACVVLWYPALDRTGTLTHGARLLALVDGHARFWVAPRFRHARGALVLALVLLALAGATRLHMQDDVRVMQDPSPGLRAEEAAIQRLTGAGGGAQFLLVRTTSTESALQAEEAVLPMLAEAQRDGLLTGFQATASFVPSAARQAANRDLVARALLPHLPMLRDAMGFEAPLQAAASTPLLPAQLPAEGPLGLVRALSLEPGVHLVLLQGVTDLATLRQRLVGMPEIGVISLADDWSALFGQYRRQTMLLLALSALLMVPLLAWRYRHHTWRVLAPPLAAVLLAPPLAALTGAAFTFFDAMALVLVLSIGVDYAVFCAETTAARRPVTMLAVALAALSTILSFGLLAASEVFAVRAFGFTMLLGVTLAFLLAPMATRRG